MAARLIARNVRDRGQAALDAYTPAHFAVGFAAGALGVSPVTAALVLTATKVAIAAAEHGLGHALFSRDRGESNLNELCDLLAEISGVDAGAKFRASRAQPGATAGIPLLPIS
jgi:hypothetical protein